MFQIQDPRVKKFAKQEVEEREFKAKEAERLKKAAEEAKAKEEAERKEREMAAAEAEKEAKKKAKDEKEKKKKLAKKAQKKLLEAITPAIVSKAEGSDVISDSDNLDLLFSKLSLEEISDLTVEATKDAAAAMKSMALRVQMEK